MAIDLTVACATQSFTVHSLAQVLALLPQGYEVVLEADDMIPIHVFRILVDPVTKTVRLTNWN